MIPKKLFQTWETNDTPFKMSQAIESWKQKNPTWEHKLFTAEDRVEFIENLSLEEFGAFKQFFSTMPVLEKEIEFTCKNKECEKTSTFYMNGYLDFFV